MSLATHKTRNELNVQHFTYDDAADTTHFSDDLDDLMLAISAACPIADHPAHTPVAGFRDDDFEDVPF